MKTSSSSSTKPISPVCSHPSLSIMPFVASSSLRYPVQFNQPKLTEHSNVMDSADSIGIGLVFGN